MKLKEYNQHDQNAGSKGRAEGVVARGHGEADYTGERENQH